MLSSDAAHAERVSPPPHRASGQPLHPFAAFVTEASRRFGVPEHWIRAVMHVESGAKTAGALIEGRHGLDANHAREPGPNCALATVSARIPMIVSDNILAGAAYIRELHDRYGAPGFLAAYNAGPGRYERHLATGRPLPDETQAYVAALAPMINRAPTNVQPGAVARSFAWANSSLFATRHRRHPTRRPISGRHVRVRPFFTHPRHCRPVGPRTAVGQPVRTSYQRD